MSDGPDDGDGLLQLYSKWVFVAHRTPWGEESDEASYGQGVGSEDRSPTGEERVLKGPEGEGARCSGPGQQSLAAFAAVLDSRTLRSTPESGHRAGYDGAKRKKGSKVHAAVNTLGHLLALHVTPAAEQDRAQVEELAWSMQEATGESVELAYVNQGYTGEEPAEAAKASGIRLKVVKHPGPKKGFVLLPRR